MRPSHPILRRIYDDRLAVQEQLLAGSSTSMTAEQIGARYLSLIGRYQTLAELEEFVAEVLQKGDYIDQDDNGSAGNAG